MAGNYIEAQRLIHLYGRLYIDILLRRAEATSPEKLIENAQRASYLRERCSLSILFILVPCGRRMAAVPARAGPAFRGSR